jgi:hypothetical protein
MSFSLILELLKELVDDSFLFAHFEEELLPLLSDGLFLFGKG